MTQLKYNDLLHAKIFLDEVHASRTLSVLEYIRIFAVQAIHHVLLKVLEEIDFVLELFRRVSELIALTHERASSFSGRNIIDMPKRMVSACKNDAE